MKTLLRFLLPLVLILAPLRAENLVLGGRVLLGATVRKLDAFTARITHDAGTSTVPAWELSDAQQRNFGFDPSATAAERARREDAARTAEAARQREVARVAEAEAAAARAKELEDQRASADRIAKANAAEHERNRAKQQYDRNRAALLHWAIAQSEARDGLRNKWVKKDDLPILRQLFNSGLSVADLLNTYQIPH